MEYGGRATLAEAFAIVEQCDRALCQHDATDLVSLLVDSSKSRKAPAATAGLAETEVDKTLYCWSCGRSGHAKKDCPSKPKHAQNQKRKPVVPAKDSAKDAGNHLPKQLKCSHCGRNNHAVENCFALHPEKRPSTDRKKLEAIVGAFEERFKNLASSGQISDVPSFFGARASYFTLDYYMFGASREVVSSTAVTRVQSVSRATPTTTGEAVESLRARNSSYADQIGQARLPLSFGLADAVQSLGSHNPHVDISDPATDVVHTLASKLLH